MQVTAAKEIRDKLKTACCHCKQVREAAEVQRALRDAIEGESSKSTAQVIPSTSFNARPQPR